MSPSRSRDPRRAEVQAIARWATRHRVPLVPGGDGSGISGGATAVDGALMLSFERMQQIIEIDPLAMLARVQPGVMNSTLKLAAEAEGLWYPPDPSSFDVSSIGGNVATNAGGLCCVKYAPDPNDIALALVARNERRKSRHTLSTNEPPRSVYTIILNHRCRNAAFDHRKLVWIAKRAKSRSCVSRDAP